jgi:hypothetical protein
MFGVRTRVLFGAGLAAGSVMGFAGVANASAGGGCPANLACLYENNSYNSGNTDHWHDFSGTTNTFGPLVWFDSATNPTSDGMDNETSSIKNTRSGSVTLWQNNNYGGASSTFAGGTSISKLSLWNIGDNRASSITLN